MSSTTGNKKKADLKVVIMGSANVGKTTFIHRYIDGTFQETISTIGASFSLKQHGPFNVAIWDTAGEERFTGLSSFYCRNAGAAILAYDLTSEDSFHHLRARFVPLLQSADPDCLVIVIGMKHDLVSKDNHDFDKKDALMLAKELNSRKLHKIPYYQTSSMTGHNVKKVFDEIFEICLPAKPPPSGVVDITTPSKKSKESSSCGC